MFLLSFVALTFSYLALAHEPSPLQDFCVADPNSPGILIFKTWLLHINSLCS